MKNAKLLILLVALALAGAACGGKSAEERILEEILESGDGDITDFNIDADGDDFNITFEGEDGEDININTSGDEDDFSMVIEGDDGEVMTFGTGELPEGLLVPVPDGGKIIQTFTSNDNITAVLEYPASQYDPLVDVYDGALGGDDVQRSESSYSTDDGTIRSVNWYANDASILVSVADCYSTADGELASVCVTINQTGS